MKKIIFTLFFLLISNFTFAELKCWYGFEAAPYGTTLNGYTAISPDFAINTGYAWSNPYYKWGVDSSHTLKYWDTTSGGPPYHAYMGYAGVFPITIIAKISTTGTTGQYSGIITRGRDNTSSTTSNIGGFLRNGSGKVEVGVGTVDTNGTWTSVSNTAYQWAVTTNQIYAFKVVDYGGDLGATICAYFDADGNTPTTLRISAWVGIDPNAVSYLKAGISKNNPGAKADDFRILDTDTTQTPTPTITQTPTITPTCPIDQFRIYDDLPTGYFSFTRPYGMTDAMNVVQVWRQSDGNTVNVWAFDKGTNYVQYTQGNHTDCTGENFKLITWYDESGYGHDLKGWLDYPDIILNYKNGYPAVHSQNIQSVISDTPWVLASYISSTLGECMILGKQDLTPQPTASAVDFLPHMITDYDEDFGMSSGIIGTPLGDNKFYIYNLASDGGTTRQYLSQNYIKDTWVQGTWKIANGNLYGWINGSSLGNTPSSNVGYMSAHIRGVASASQGSFSGYIQSIAFFNTNLSDERIQSYYNYLYNGPETLTPTPTASPTYTITPTFTASPIVTPTPTPMSTSSKRKRGILNYFLK
jgi:hypothetical protein